MVKKPLVSKQAAGGGRKKTIKLPGGLEAALTNNVKKLAKYQVFAKSLRMNPGTTRVIPSPTLSPKASHSSDTLPLFLNKSVRH